MANNTAYLILKKDNLDKIYPLCVFLNERDALSHISDLKKYDNDYSVSGMNYQYLIQTIIVYSGNMKV